MQIYNNKSWNLNQIKEVWFKLEKDMQKLTEDNMENIFWLEFIKTEFQLNNLRIDSLAFDVENNSFVIIEYKRWSSYSVVDQWMSYLSLMLHNKADFVQELSRKRKKFIDTKHIEWSGSRVIIIADAFTRHQKESINFKDFPIELYELKQFSNDVVVFNPIKASHTSESIKTVTRLGTEEFKEVNKEIKTSSPIFRAHMNIIERMAKQNGSLYSDMQTENQEYLENVYPIWKSESENQFERTEKKDKQWFEEVMSEIQDFVWKKK